MCLLIVMATKRFGSAINSTMLRIDDVVVVVADFVLVLLGKERAGMNEETLGAAKAATVKVKVGTVRRDAVAADVRVGANAEMGRNLFNWGRFVGRGNTK